MYTAESNSPHWSRDPSELMEAMSTGARGLASTEAAERLRRRGPNIVEDQPRVTVLRQLLRQFESPLVLILVFGAMVSMVLKDWVEATIILAIVLGSTLLGFAQEHRAGAAVAALSRRLALTVQVVRDGTVQIIAASAIVPGDVVRLAAGNLVPADGVVLEAKDFLVTEASLTGESFPVEKQPGILAAATPLASRTNCVFLGTSVRSGTATVLVMKTGRDTAFGAVAARLRERGPETEFARGVRQFGYLLVRVTVVMVVFVLAVNQMLGRPLFESLLFAVALAVGISPELLPAIVSVTLARGAHAMARRGVIVRRPEAIEDLGSMDVLCTDKTGTLTGGVIALDAAVDPQQKERIVRALQRTGHAVGYLGDGINDAPALHAADVGISVEKAVDVARESADVILLRHDLDVLRRGVADGRATFANTLKYISITTSANFGNMVSMALATPLLPFMPLAAKQILLNNFLSDLPSIAISTDNVDAERTVRAQRWDVNEVRRFMIVFGLISTVFDLLTFALLLQVFEADERTFQTAWFVVSLLTELAVVLVLRTHRPAMRSAPSRLLLWTTLAVGALAVGIPYAGPLAALFAFVPLSWQLLVTAILVVAAYILTTEVAKVGFFGMNRR